MNRHFCRWAPVAFLLIAWSWAAGFGCLCSMGGGASSCSVESDYCWIGHLCPDGSCQQCCSNSDCAFVEICDQGNCRIDCYDQFCECCRSDPGCDCCQDTDCGADKICVFEPAEPIDGEEQKWTVNSFCVDRCLLSEENCDRDDLICCSGMICAPDSLLCEAACASDDDCVDRSDRYGGDLLCVDQLCRHRPCSDALDCNEEQLCSEGACLTPLSCDEVAYCEIEAENLAIEEGERRLVEATAHLRDHDQALVAGFEWTSSDVSILEVEQDGTLIGIAIGGPVEVTAQVIGCEVTCASMVEVFLP